MDVDSARSAAQRGRERRLRQWLTVAMAPAEKVHHTSRGQKIARAREVHYAMGQTTPPPKAAAAEFYPLTPDVEVGGELAAGRRPAPLVEVRPQGRVQRHAVEHIVDLSPFVQILDVPVPQMVDQLLEVLKMLDTDT